MGAQSPEESKLVATTGSVLVLLCAVVRTL